MNQEQQDIYDEGYSAFLDGVEDHSNPRSGLDAEYWSDGWEDSNEDN